jgi:hypothetical protein
LPLRMIASEYSESEVWTYTQTVMHALPCCTNCPGQPTTSAPRRAARFRGPDVAAAHQRFSERVNAEG